MAGHPTSRGGQLARLRTAVTGALWPLPAVLIVGAIGLGVGLPILDEALRDPGRVCASWWTLLPVLCPRGSTIRRPQSTRCPFCRPCSGRSPSATRGTGG